MSRYTILQTDIPNQSCYRDFIRKLDYSDAFTITHINPKLSLQEAYIQMFSNPPKWIKILMKIRNSLVSFIGLKHDLDTSGIDTPQFKIGKIVGMFSLYYISNNEIIAGEDDKHLDFRVSLLKHEDTLTVSTFVKYNNLFGKVYMFFITPMHKIVVKNMMKKLI